MHKQPDVHTSQILTGKRPPNATKISLLGTLDWVLVVSCLLLVISSILLLVNGTCSKPSGLSANRPLCTGSNLSVQAWLAIVGVEFSLLGLVVLPRARDVLVSKQLTSRMTSNGLQLSAVLNSQPTAPFMTQIRNGMKRLAVLRLLVVFLASGVSIAYKFSFQQTNSPVRIPFGGGPNDALDALLALDTLSNLYDRSNRYGPISESMNDILTGTSTSSIHPNISSMIKDPSVLIFGPSFNVSRMSQKLLHGTATHCGLAVYSRNTLQPSAAGWSDSAPEIPYRANVSDYSERFVNHGHIVDVTTLYGNGSLLARFGVDPLQNNPRRYDSMLIAKIQVCVGFHSWVVDGTRTYFQPPTEVNCVDEPHDYNDYGWEAAVARGILHGLLDGQGMEDLFDLSLVVPLLLSSIDHVLGQYDPYAGHSWDYRTNPSCPSTMGRGTFMIDGIIAGHRTGMTLIGFVLQVLALVVGVFVAMIVAWPTLPLVSEWPAQWISLTHKMDSGIINRAVKGTGNAIGGGEHVYLSSSFTEGDVPQLVIKTERGEVLKGIWHI